MVNWRRWSTISELLAGAGLVLYVISESSGVQPEYTFLPLLGLAAFTVGVMGCSLPRALEAKPDVMSARDVTLGWGLVTSAALMIFMVFVPEGYVDVIPAVIGVIGLGFVYIQVLELIEPRDAYRDDDTSTDDEGVSEGA